MHFKNSLESDIEDANVCFNLFDENAKTPYQIDKFK